MEDIIGAPATYAMIAANLIEHYGLAVDRGFVGAYAFNVGAYRKRKTALSHLHVIVPARRLFPSPVQHDDAVLLWT
ncbi:MAG: hypothetical protein R3C58_14015 [Parvularculaceae bacterium]